MVNYTTALNVKRLRHAEFYQLLVCLVEDFKSANLKAKDEDFNRLLTGIRTQLPTLQLALEQVKSSEKSKSISDLDAERDRTFQALVDSIKPYRYSSVVAERNAYTALKLLLNHYKGTATKNYEEESSVLASLLLKLKSEEYQDDVTALGLAKFVTNLTNAQNAFETLFNARSKENLTKVSYDVKQLRRTLEKEYQILIDYIGILATVKAEPFYKQALGVVNNGCKYFADTLARRKAKAKETPEDTTTV
ncbi:DUF6261 family protein [Aerococcaceae bacterium NML160702]|nr:DUF6261 family protein [Aerococcaceae bacterium NML160702]